MPLDKTQIARRQLGTALALFLEDRDPVSVHTLACAGCEIVEHLTRKAGRAPFTTRLMMNFPDFDMARIRRAQNQYCNAFKHATKRDGKTERDDEELLERFDDTVNDHALYVGWDDYMRAVGSLPIEAQVFLVWYFVRYPEKLEPEFDLTPYKQCFPKLNEMNRADQKRALREVIEVHRKDHELMSNPGTDPTLLIL